MIQSLLLLNIISYFIFTNCFINNKYIYISKRPLSKDTSLKSVGSDLLERPEDENSPEFKEYLRQLLRLQANRAKTGYSAPSSASSDAYFAKLTRLKIEKRKLREAGLPEDLLDTSYRPEDYKAAIYEGQDPLVSDKILRGEDAIPGRAKSGKLRALTEEEIAITREAEMRVQLAIEEAKAKGIPFQPPPPADLSPSTPPVIQTDPELDAAIEALLSGKGVYSAAASIGYGPSKQTSSNPRPATPIQNTNEPSTIGTDRKKSLYTRAIESTTPSSITVPSPNPVTIPPKPVSAVNSPVIPPKPSVPTIPQKPTVQATTKTTAIPPKPITSTVVHQNPVAPAASVPTNIPPKPTEETKAQQIPEPVPNTIPVSASTAVAEKQPFKVGKKQIKEKRLEKNELEKFAKTLQLLVKHRGGGPFGPGRLVGQDQIDLVNNLKDVVLFLENETYNWDISEEKSDLLEQKSDLTEDIVSSDVSLKSSTKASDSLKQNEPVKSDNSEELNTIVKSTEKSVVEPSKNTGLEVLPKQSVSLVLPDGKAYSLSSISTQELISIRENLLNSLAAIQTELISRSNAPPVLPIAASPVPSSPSSTISSTSNESIKISQEEVEEKEDITPSQQRAHIQATSNPSTDLTKEVLTTLGLLLKHRGGPGFGHGRLEGKELDLLESKLRQVSQALLVEALNK